VVPIQSSLLGKYNVDQNNISFKNIVTQVNYATVNQVGIANLSFIQQQIFILFVYLIMLLNVSFVQGTLICANTLPDQFLVICLPIFDLEASYPKISSRYL